ncbi:hypothetical protein [Flammeovirga sp. SJP92]|uniref:hypothetical protein n=1 Tax=Flammeovirga sp. SJP92 TaxID=1775430 RepID=UPI0007885BDB|nr:hypothetical protein [Flammeovirga sp. SJP92]KXX70003.1 hypothetical protein AVL50_14090 [Flammeovirga sp. SJP92]
MINIKFIFIIFLWTFCLSSISVYSQIKVIQNGDKLEATFDENVISKPDYDEVMGFTEDILLLRRKNVYSYYTLDGTCIYKSKADLAYPFKHGKGKVIVKSIPKVINREGKVEYNGTSSLKDILINPKSYTLITWTGKYGLLDSDYEIKLDTVSQYISKFNYGNAVIQGEDYFFTYSLSGKYKYSDQNTRIGIVNENGEFIVNYGKYIAILYIDRNDFQTIRADGEHVKLSFEKTMFSNKNENLNVVSDKYKAKLGIDLDTCSNTEYDRLTIVKENNQLNILIPEKFHEYIKRETLNEYLIQVQVFHKEKKEWIDIAIRDDYYADHFIDFNCLKLCQYSTNKISGSYKTKVRVVYSRTLSKEKIYSNIIETGVNYQLFLVDWNEPNWEY